MTDRSHRHGVPRAAALLFALTAAQGCAPLILAPCTPGVLPFDGATGVPLDATVRFAFTDDLGREIPPLDDAILFVVDASGRKVDADYAYDARTHTIEVIPREPLLADTDYRVGGIDWETVRGANSHYWTQVDYGWTSATFTTRPGPQALGAFRFPEEQRLVIAFSEPVDPATVDGALELTWGDRSIAEATVMGSFADEDHLVEVILDSWPTEQRPAVAISEGVVGLNGAPMEVEPHTPIPTLQYPDLIRMSGLDACEEL